MISVLELLRCPVCESRLSWEAFEKDFSEGCVWCSSCLHFYPIENGLLELLPPNLCYWEDRQKFWEKYKTQLQKLGLELKKREEGSSADLQRKQQVHFDWYATNEKQSYRSYEAQPFWEAADVLTFSGWKKKVAPGSRLLDIGCAQGRSAFKWMDLPISIVGFDISKSAVRQAIERYRAKKQAAQAFFFCADASKLPFAPETFDCAVTYGVLHHLPDPAETCSQIARILKPGGLYFGSENNQSALRSLFDLLMKLKPLWAEEAGKEPLISSGQFRGWLRSMDVEIDTHVFVPPHLVNLLGHRLGYPFLKLTDWAGSKIPWISKQGGLIRCCARKTR